MIGSRISAYEVLSELGSGGMGSVYLAQCAEQAAGLDEGVQVALKVIHPNLLSQPGFFKRFLREAQIGKDVQHENVVRTYDCDATLVDGAQHNFLVMEYVEGQTLRDLLEELERVPEELCRHIGREVAKGLAAIHEAGVVHRDIKPENVLITEEHVVKVMDLGVARLQDEAIRLSQAGAFVGSLEYAAPEQFRSANGEPDGRADLHSLGVVLYELATGQHPYRDEDASKVLRNILDEEPRKAGEVNPQLSPFFEEVVHTLVAKDRGVRFADAVVLAGVLEEGESGDWWKDRAKALRIETKRPLRRIRVPRETALYGRDDDLGKLHALFDNAKAGDGQVLLIEGEAGIGKTRLVDEFVGRLRQEGEDVNFLFGSYPPGGAATAAGAFSEAYREQFGQEGSAPWLSQTPILVPAFDALLRGEPTPKDAQGLTKDSLQAVFVHATRALATERTTMVLIDDLHFAPDDGRALFASLAMAVPGHRLLLVGTSRPGIPEDWVANLERTGHFLRMGLSRLGPKDLMGLLRDSFRSERLAEELGHQIAVKSDGNPFFAFEIIRGLREGQFITQQEDGTWVSTQVIEDIQIPSSVLDLLNARVADLTEDERNLLDVAACWGFEFDPVLVGDALGLPRIPTLRALGQIERRHRLVRSQGRRYCFDHHQVQEALYGSLNDYLREEYHAALAEALESAAKAADQDPEMLDGALCVDLCEHYLKGARGEAALRYLDAAQAHLEQGQVHAQVIALTERVLSVPGLLTGPARARTLVRLASALRVLMRFARQEECAREAARLAEAEGDDELRSQAARALGTVLAQTVRLQEAETVLCRALELDLALGDRRAEANTARLLGLVFQTQGRHPEAQASTQRAIALSRETEDRACEAGATVNLGNSFSFEGRLSQARKQYERGLALCREIGHRHFEAISTGNLGFVDFLQGRSREAQERFERQLALGREIGDRQSEILATGWLGQSLLFQGHLAEAKEQIARQLAQSLELGSPRGQAVATTNLGVVLHSHGRLGDAQQRIEQSLALSREIGDRTNTGWSHYSLGCVLRDAGKRPESQEHFAAAVADSTRFMEAMARLALGSLLASAGDDEAAREALAAARDVARELEAPGTEVCARCELALLPGGDAHDALAALAKNGERLYPFERQNAHLLLFRATGDDAHLVEAKRLLDEALAKAPEDYHEGMLTNLRVNREIMQAWNESHDPERA